MPTSSRLLFALLLTLLTLAPASRADDALAPIEASAVIDAPIAEVWHAWTTSEGLESFLVEKANIELRPGGPYEIFFSMQAPEGARGSENCSVLSFLPNQMLSFQWNAPPKFEHARFIHTWVVVNFEELSPSRTRVDLTHLGFAENAADNPDHTEEWKQVRAYFTNAWPSVMNALTEHFGGTDPGEARRTLNVLARLVGGEWVFEDEMPNGSKLLSRSVVHLAADGKSLIASGWLGDESGMWQHISGQIWIEPDSQLVKYQSITESGSFMRGYFELVDDNTVIEHIIITDKDGNESGPLYAVLKFEDENHQSMILKRGDAPLMPKVTYERVDKAPEKLRTLTDGTVVD